MSKKINNILIKNKQNELVALINVKDTVLHGHCEWYDKRGNLIAYGFFKNGAPFTGTFLNWTNFFTELRKENPYDAIVYCQDWVSKFEACFLSELPNYAMVIEAYYNGCRLGSLYGMEGAK